MGTAAAAAGNPLTTPLKQLLAAEAAEQRRKELGWVCVLSCICMYLCVFLCVFGESIAPFVTRSLE